jgi:hypothetical protein
MFRGKPPIKVIRSPTVGMAVSVAVGVAVMGEVALSWAWPAKRGESPRVVAVPSAMLYCHSVAKRQASPLAKSSFRRRGTSHRPYSLLDPLVPVPTTHSSPP